jgi:hypothetical protein
MQGGSQAQLATHGLMAQILCKVGRQRCCPHLPACLTHLLASLLLPNKYRAAGIYDSLTKLRRVQELCERLGVHTQPRQLGSLWVVPVFRWGRLGWPAAGTCADPASLHPVESLRYCTHPPHTCLSVQLAPQELGPGARHPRRAPGLCLDNC